MNKSSLYVSVLALAVSVAAVVISVKKCDTAKQPATVNAEQIAAILKDQPKMVVDAIESYQLKQREAQIAEAAKLFKDNIEAINNSPNVPFVGKADAKVVLAEFFDFSCGYCKRLAPTIEKIVAANPDIKVVFQPITFVSPEISTYAAKAALAAAEQGKFMPVYKDLLGYQGRLTKEAVDEIAAKNELDMAKYREDMEAKKANDVLKGVASLAEKVQIHGVPTLLLNGTQLQTFDPEAIQEEINKLK